MTCGFKQLLDHSQDIREATAAFRPLSKTPEGICVRILKLTFSLRGKKRLIQLCNKEDGNKRVDKGDNERESFKKSSSLIIYSDKSYCFV